MDAYQRLIDGLPARLPPGHSQRMSEKAMREALASVPLANPARAEHDVEQLLDGMLATTLNGGERIAALAHLDGPVASLCRGIERKLGIEPHPLPPARAERAVLAQRLEWKLASAYAIGLHELCAPAGKVPLFKSKIVAGASVCGLVHAGQALLWAYRQYQAPPAGTWRLLHALHGFAQDVGLADQPVADPRLEAGALSSRSAYLQMLLLAASNPNRFSARELRDAEAVIRCVAGQCGLAPATGPGVAVDALADAGPVYFAEDALGAGVLALDVEPAMRIFEERAALLPAGVEVVELPRPGAGAQTARVDFLRHLQAGWVTAARGHGRLAASHVLEVAVGMHALHYALAGGVDFATFVRRVHSEAIAAGRHELASASAWAVGADAAQSPVIRGDVLDQSEGGYRLRLQVDGNEGARLRVGDLVGLATAADSTDEREWMVGVIRWLTHAEDGELVGVELLHRTARAAGLRPLGADGKPLVPQRAIELPGPDGQASLSMLVANRLPREVTTAEVVLPALVSDWKVPAAAGIWHFDRAEDIGVGCVRVTLVRESRTAEASA